MLKVVPDPPLTRQERNFLEDVLIQSTEHLACARSISKQNATLSLPPDAHSLNLAVQHEIETASGFVEMALSKIQVNH